MSEIVHTTIVALYVHGERSSRPEDTEPTPMLSIERAESVPERGIRQDRRFFRPADPGRVRKRQVSLIDEGTIRRHEARFGPFDWRFVKSQIVLSGDVRLSEMIGAVIEFDGGPEMVIALEREPCYAMDLIAPGLKNAMEDGEQGVLAMVTRGGELYRGQSVTIRLPAKDTAPREALVS